MRALRYDRASDVIAAAEQVGKNVVTLSDQLDDDAGGVAIKQLNVGLADVSEAAILF